MVYVKQTWVDGPDGKTPIDAEHLTHIEEGIYAAAATADSTTGLDAYKSENDAAVAAVRSTANAALPKSLASATYATKIDLKATTDASLTKADAAATYATQTALAAVKSTADAALPKTTVLAQDNQIVVDGKGYQASGTATLGNPTAWARPTGDLNVVMMPFTPPFTPPSGYGWDVSLAGSNGWDFLMQASTLPDGTRTYIECRMLRLFSSTLPSNVVVVWQLVKVS